MAPQQKCGALLFYIGTVELEGNYCSSPTPRLRRSTSSQEGMLALRSSAWSEEVDIRELKDLLKNSTSVLILDEGEPSYVILDYQVYRSLAQTKEQEIKVKKNNDAEVLNFPVPQASEEVPARAVLSAQEVEALERLNREIQALKDQIEQDEKQGGFEGNR